MAPVSIKVADKNLRISLLQACASCVWSWKYSIVSPNTDSNTRLEIVGCRGRTTVTSPGYVQRLDALVYRRLQMTPFHLLQHEHGTTSEEQRLWSVQTTCITFPVPMEGSAHLCLSYRERDGHIYMKPFLAISFPLRLSRCVS